MYRSTRSGISASDTGAVLKGIAPDGGLFADDGLIDVTDFDAKGCIGLPYEKLAEKIMSRLLPGFAGEMADIVSVYGKKFSAEKITPLVRVGDDYALELFHGPTSAFKDVALSVLPLFITEARKKEGIDENISILTATSGDTGKAALEGFHDVPGTDITVFFPDGGVSDMQKAQMVTQSGANVRVCAVRGNFDDCQRGVKEAFAQKTAKRLSSANSINIGRLVPQAVYYFSAYSQLCEEGRITFGDKVDFIVPTGNFGDILAGYIARQLGLPVGRLVCASNSNNVLADFLRTGVYDKRRPFLKTVSPSMDILVSSNLERMLFYASAGDGELVARLMRELGENGVYALEGKPLEVIRSVFSAGYATEEDTADAIARIWRSYGKLFDTHTAVAFSVMEKYKKSREYSGAPCVVLSTASPFKFPHAVLGAIGGNTEGDGFTLADELSRVTGVPVPANLAGLRDRKAIHTDVIDVSEIVAYSLK